jgi:hypothetical protein
MNLRPTYLPRRKLMAKRIRRIFSGFKRAYSLMGLRVIKRYDKRAKIMVSKVKENAVLTDFPS